MSRSMRVAALLSLLLLAVSAPANSSGNAVIPPIDEKLELQDAAVFGREFFILARGQRKLVTQGIVVISGERSGWRIVHRLKPDVRHARFAVIGGELAIVYSNESANERADKRLKYLRLRGSAWDGETSIDAEGYAGSVSCSGDYLCAAWNVDEWYHYFFEWHSAPKVRVMLHHLPSMKTRTLQLTKPGKITQSSSPIVMATKTGACVICFESDIDGKQNRDLLVQYDVLLTGNVKRKVLSDSITWGDFDVIQSGNGRLAMAHCSGKTVRLTQLQDSTKISETVIGEGHYPAVRRAPDGTIHIFWMDQKVKGGFAGSDLLFHRSLRAGKLSPVETIQDIGSSEFSGDLDEGRPYIPCLRPDGSWSIVWESEGTLYHRICSER